MTACPCGVLSCPGCLAPATADKSATVECDNCGCWVGKAWCIEIPVGTGWVCTTDCVKTAAVAEGMM